VGEQEGNACNKHLGGGGIFLEFLLEELVRIHLNIRSEIEHSYRENK